MILAWLGMALLAGAWLWGTGYYHAPHWMTWGVLTGAGAVLLTGALRRLPGRTTALTAAVLLVPAAILTRWPYCAGPGLAAVGLLISSLPISRRWARWLATGTIVAGVAIVAQGLALWTYECLTARSHDLPGALTWLVAAVVRLMGVDAAPEVGHVAMYSMRQVHRLAATWELLLDPVSLCYVVGGVLLIILRTATREGKWRSWAAPVGGFLLAMAVWLPLRAGLLAVVYMHRVLRTGFDEPFQLMTPFWSEWVHLALLAVPVLIAWRLTPARGETSAEPSDAGAPPRWRALLAGVLAFAGVAALTAAVLFNPVGQRKPGRIIFDERHSQAGWPSKSFDTTRSDKPFDTTWYGHESAYNFACIYDYCRRFYTMSQLKRAIDDDALRDCDVLVLKLPSLEFSDAEIAAVRRFVDRGGGLLLIGEHTSVYGSGVYLNQIARTYGFAFRDDCLFGIDSVFEQHYVPPATPHPVIQNAGPFDFATSCSIAPGAGDGRAVIRATGLKNLHADYHAPNTYPQAVDRPDMRYGAFVQLWATQQGRGRVLAFTDSTIFANFSAFEPGKRELFLGMLEWLNHREGGRPWPWLAALGVLLLAATVVLARGSGGAWLGAFAAGVLGVTVASTGIGALQRQAMPLPEPVRPFVEIAVGCGVSDVKLPRNGFVAGLENGFGLFERCILRVGHFPFRSDGTDLARADAVVLPYPNQPIDPAFASRLGEYVKSGGRVVVLDSPENTSSTANELLQLFGLSVDRSTNLSGDVPAAGRRPGIRVDAACAVRGGEEIATLEGQTVGATRQHGKGTVTVVGFGGRFCDANMGVTGDIIPDAALRAVYEYAYTLLRQGPAAQP